MRKYTTNFFNASSLTEFIIRLVPFDDMRVKFAVLFFMAFGVLEILNHVKKLLFDCQNSLFSAFFKRKRKKSLRF